MIAPEQLDIFIPLQRGGYLRRWSGLAAECDADLEQPDGPSAFASWLRAHGHAPADLSHEAVTVLVAVMREYEPTTPARHG